MKAFDTANNTGLRASPNANATTRANRFAIPLKHVLAQNTFNHMNTDKLKYVKCKQLLSDPMSSILIPSSASLLHWQSNTSAAYTALQSSACANPHQP
jgi:hypothetical protein